MRTSPFSLAGQLWLDSTASRRFLALFMHNKRILLVRERAAALSTLRSASSRRRSQVEPRPDPCFLVELSLRKLHGTFLRCCSGRTVCTLSDVGGQRCPTSLRRTADALSSPARAARHCSPDLHTASPAAVPHSVQLGVDRLTGTRSGFDGRRSVKAASPRAHGSPRSLRTRTTGSTDKLMLSSRVQGKRRARSTLIARCHRPEREND